MCGIAGVLGPCSPETLRSMCDVIAHRGPDDQGYYQDERVSLGMRRLSIIDLAGGHQPVTNEVGTLQLIFNGEIYNYRELAELLRGKGHVLRTASDTETSVHLYEEYGPACVHALRGMFAFALWDSRKQQLLLARDRVGIKPLYYTEVDGALIFGSEIKSLLEHPASRREVDHEALDTYLTLQYVPGPRTLFAGIRKLPPGHILVAGPAGIHVRQYWDVAFCEPGRAMDERETAAELRRLISDAVKGEMIADVPLGALLSGGVDSASVVGLMSQGATAPVRTFTIGFPGLPAYNELEDAAEIARHFRTDHHPLSASAADVELLPSLIWHMDEPVADAAALPTFLICRYARERVKVVLTGEGGDELFGGYPRYAWFAVARRLQRSLPGWLRDRELAPAARALPHARARLLGDLVLPTLPDEERHLAWVGIFSRGEKARLYAPGVDQRPRALGSELVLERLKASEAPDPLHALMYLDLKSWLVDDILVKVDKMSMAASLEARVPLLDHRVIEFAATIPIEQKIRRLETKRVLKRAVRDLLPPAVFARRKHAFQVPVREWLRAGKETWAREVLLSQAARARGYFDSRCVELLLDDHESGRRDHGRQLWNLLCLELWHQIFLDRTLRPAPLSRVV